MKYMNKAGDVLKELEYLKNSEKIKVFKRFFKTNEGEYGYGDMFWGISVPQVRGISKRYFRDISFDEIKVLINHRIHEIRLAGYLILTYQYEKSDNERRKDIFDFYLNNLSGCNNWDLVDLSCYKIVGEYLLKNKEERRILYELSRSNNLWEQRISIVSTLPFIKRKEFKDTLNISKVLLSHSHDLIHKAVGWMLREVGKQDMNVLREFLNENINTIPRTTLRYSIERMNESERKKYLLKSF